MPVMVSRSSQTASQQSPSDWTDKDYTSGENYSGHDHNYLFRVHMNTRRRYQREYYPFPAFSPSTIHHALFDTDSELKLVFRQTPEDDDPSLARLDKQQECAARAISG